HPGETMPEAGGRASGASRAPLLPFGHELTPARRNGRWRIHGRAPRPRRPPPLSDDPIARPPPRTPFICTIGQKVADAGSIRRLAASGMSIARVNGSHGTIDDVRALVRALKRDLPKGIPILLDLPGNKIRTDGIAEPIALAAGQTFVLKPEML